MTEERSIQFRETQNVRYLNLFDKIDYTTTGQAIPAVSLISFILLSLLISSPTFDKYEPFF